MSQINPNFSQNVDLPVIVDKDQYKIELENYYNSHSAHRKKLQWTNEKIQSVMRLVEDYNSAKFQGGQPTNKEYYHANKYDIMNVGNGKILIKKRKKISDPVIKVISEVTLPLRTIASMSTSFGGQGMRHCNSKFLYKGQCISNKCTCKKVNILCNSRCHSSLPCGNK